MWPHHPPQDETEARFRFTLRGEGMASPRLFILYQRRLIPPLFPENHVILLEDNELLIPNCFSPPGLVSTVFSNPFLDLSEKEWYEGKRGLVSRKAVGNQASPCHLLIRTLWRILETKPGWRGPWSCLIWKVPREPLHKFEQHQIC